MAALSDLVPPPSTSLTDWLQVLWQAGGHCGKAKLGMLLSTPWRRARDWGGVAMLPARCCLRLLVPQNSGHCGKTPSNPLHGHFSRPRGLPGAGLGTGRGGDRRSMEGPLETPLAWGLLPCCDPRPACSYGNRHLERSCCREPSPGGCQAQLLAARWDLEVPFPKTIPAGSESEGSPGICRAGARMEEEREEKEGSE